MFCVNTKYVLLQREYQRLMCIFLWVWLIFWCAQQSGNYSILFFSSCVKHHVAWFIFSLVNKQLWQLWAVLIVLPTWRHAIHPAECFCTKWLLQVCTQNHVSHKVLLLKYVSFFTVHQKSMQSKIKIQTLLVIRFLSCTDLLRFSIGRAHVMI